MHNDDYCWHYTTLGNYTVRSGYEIFRNNRDEDTCMLLQQPSVNPLKAYVWKIRPLIKFIIFSGNVFLGQWPSMNGWPICTWVWIESARDADNPKRPLTVLFFHVHQPTMLGTITYTTSKRRNTMREYQGEFRSPFWRLWTGTTMIEVTRAYTWVILYIWKARNDKLFNAIDRSPLDTIDLAKKESAEWFLANYPGIVTDHNPHAELNPDLIRPTFTCFVDGSWKHGDLTSGTWWVLELQNGTLDLLGLQGN